MTDFVIGLGGNLGDPAANLAEGATRVSALPEVHVSGLSRVYDTEPVGPPQPRYLNAALRVRCSCSAEALLDRLLEIEHALGRVRDVRWGARTLDLDLLWSERAVASARLQVPHPRLRERAFALAPLLDVAPELSSEYAHDLVRAGGAPAVYGRLMVRGAAIACERST